MSLPQVRHKAACARIEPYNIMPLIIWLSAFFLLIGFAKIVHGANVSGGSVAPNPFTTPVTTTISYNLTNSALLWLRIYDGSSVLQRGQLTRSDIFTEKFPKWLVNGLNFEGRDDQRKISLRPLFSLCIHPVER